MKADFVAQGVFRTLSRQIERALSQYNASLDGKVQVLRKADVRGWVVDGKPAVSISVESQVEMLQPFEEYLRSLSSPEESVGLRVTDLEGRLKGEITQCIGNLAEHRERLVHLTTTDSIRQKLLDSPNDTPVYSVWAARSRQEYDYAATTLKLLVYLGDCDRLGVDAHRLVSLLRIKPADRLEMVRAVYKACVSDGFLAQSFTESKAPHLFRRADTIGFSPRIRIGSNHVLSVENLRVDLAPLRQHGLYRVHPEYREKDRMMRIAIVFEQRVGDLPNDKRERLQREMERLGVRVNILPQAYSFDFKGLSSLHDAVEQATQQKPDLILALLPDALPDDEDDDPYGALKRVTLLRDLPSQVIQQTSLRDDKFNFALPNIVLGILSKTGNVPFILAEPLEFADMIVGLDIARQAKQRLQGSINATAITRIFYSSGEFVRYSIHDIPLEGETIPRSAMRSLFPPREFSGKRVLIHRDGHFRGDERETLQALAQEMGSEFYLLEVIKSSTPRIYLYDPDAGDSQEKASLPEKGFLFRLSDTEAFLVSTLPPFGNATPQPLRLVSDGKLTIEQYAHSVLAMTLLHTGSQRQPRLPVTIHYSDKIAYLALRGIKPKNSEGDNPYWL
ncbi:MAG: Piwi domain-containing protein [Fimbriimonadales bacterium]|nr:Piwi domain-containing protein [Fimbriimonadales bacterium]